VVPAAMEGPCSRTDSPATAVYEPESVQ
jgi:hypothetical protein